MNAKREIDMSVEYSTGDSCTREGYYVCKSHPYLEIWAYEGDFFPNCDKVNCGRTEWWRLL